MIRVVFEDETCLGVREVTHHLEDRGLESFASPLDSSTSPFSVSSPNSPSSTSSSSNRFSFSSSTSSYSPSSTMIPFHSLTVLAFCACPNLSPHIFRRIMLAQPHIQVFDMHKHPSTQLGEVNDAFLDIVFGDGFVKGGVEEEDDEVGEEELSLLNLNITTTTTITPSILFPSLRAVNLFGQASISPTGLCTVLRNLYAYTGGKLDSICLNFCRVDKSVVDTLIEVGKRTLKRISLCDVKVGKVKAEGKEELEGKAEENEETLSPDDVLRLVMDLDYVEVVYVVKDVYEAVVKLVAESYLDDLKMVDRCKRKLSTADSWFMLEGLDIYSLWERASKVQ